MSDVLYLVKTVCCPSIDLIFLYVSRLDVGGSAQEQCVFDFNRRLGYVLC
jgi:hypothetical protein